jgi:hypothetical protein
VVIPAVTSVVLYLLFNPAIPALFVIAYVCEASAGGRKYPPPHSPRTAGDDGPATGRTADDAAADRP